MSQQKRPLEIPQHRNVRAKKHKALQLTETFKIMPPPLSQWSFIDSMLSAVPTMFATKTSSLPPQQAEQIVSKSTEEQQLRQTAIPEPQVQLVRASTSSQKPEQILSKVTEEQQHLHDQLVQVPAEHHRTPQCGCRNENHVHSMNGLQLNDCVAPKQDPSCYS
jgi:hypothetical protein